MKKSVLMILTLFIAAAAFLCVGCSKQSEVIRIRTNEKTYADYHIPPIITVDYDGYSASDIPNAVIDNRYKIFTATAEDIYARKVNVDTAIYLYYYSDNKSLVSVEDGCFTPESYGTYTIEYSAEDLFGNKKIMTVDVKCSQAEPLSATLSNEVENGVIGQEISVADVSVDNAIGNVNVKVEAKLIEADVVYDLTGKKSFVPEYAGNYEVSYFYSDYSCSGVVKYDLTIGSGDRPIIGSVAVPEYFIVGVSYDLPLPDKCYYSVDGKKFDVTPAIFIKEEGDPDVIEITDKYTPKSEGKLEIYYVAEYNDLRNQVKYDCSIVDVGLFDELKMEKYFQGENIISSVNKDDVIISTVTDNAEMHFIRDLPSGKVRLTFGIDNKNNNFNRFDIYLTDAADATNSVKFSFVRNGYGGRFYVNDGEYADTSEGFESLVRTEFNYDGNARSATIGSSASLEVLKTVYGEPFNGFSDKVYIKMSIGGVTGYSSVHIFQIDNQSFYKEYGDGVAPYVIFEKYTGAALKVGDLIKLKRVYACDVLDPYCAVNYYVKAPDGSFVTDVNGVTVETGYDYGKDHSFIVTQSGSYVIYIGVSDSAGNEEVYAYGFTVGNKNSVAVSLEDGGETSVKAGKTVTLKKAVVSVFDDKVEYRVYVYILRPDMVMEYFADGNGAEYRPEFIGEYKVYYLVSDSNGEIVTIDYTFTVK